MGGSVIGSSLPNSQVDNTGGYPYYSNATDSTIECTTCHDVHDDPSGTGITGFRPFLRAPYSALCSKCHGARRYENAVVVSGNTVGNWVTTQVGLANPGSHPVGADITGDVSGGTTPITIPDIMTVSISGTADDWAMGGHLDDGTDTGGVVCATCHAVHGLQWDNAESVLDSTDNFVPGNNMLVVDQTAITLSGRSVANGLNDAYNALCEACHVNGAGANIDAYYNADAPSPNPGGTDFGHPVDDMELASDTSWVTGFPTDWPSGSTSPVDLTGNNTNITAPYIICESCHTPHPEANAGRSDDSRLAGGGFTDSDYILRNQIENICADCHTQAASPTVHHPVGIAYTSRPAYLTSDGGTLACSTCHAGTGAHNWGGVGMVGLDPDWIPSDNARNISAVQADQYALSMGITCMDCHLTLSGANGQSPTLFDGIVGEAEYDAIGSGTHFIGLIGGNSSYAANSNAYWSSEMGAASNVQALNWPDVGSKTETAWSRFGGTAAAPVLVCESCHELEPNKNSGVHLLLGTFTESPDVATTGFCETCHDPVGTHPMTNDTITRTEANRNLETSIVVDWLQTPTDPNLSAMGNDVFSCDNCHQVHDANTNSTSFILDVANDTALVATSVAVSRRTVAPYSATYATEYQASPGSDHSGFCDQCHPYK